jgi:hypothetical protein
MKLLRKITQVLLVREWINNSTIADAYSARITINGCDYIQRKSIQIACRDLTEISFRKNQHSYTNWEIKKKKPWIGHVSFPAQNTMAVIGALGNVDIIVWM